MMDAVFKFIRQHTPVVSSFTTGRLERYDRPAYPEDAVREGLRTHLCIATMQPSTEASL